MIWVLAIAIILGVSAIAYWALQPRAPGVPTVPNVTLGSPATVENGHVVNVTYVERADPLTEYSASLTLENASEGSLAALGNGSSNDKLSFLDVDGDNRLTVGDSFGIGPLPEGTHALTLRWRQTQVASGTIQVVMPPPAVTLAPPAPLGAGHVVNVTYVERVDSLSEYTASLDFGTVNEGRLSPLVNGSANGSLIFFDMDEDSRLTAGDAFGIGALPEGNHTLTLRWRQTPVASRTVRVFETPPTIVFGQPVAVTNGFEFDVAGASRSEPAARYRVSLQVNGTVGTEVALSASMSVTVGGDMYTVTWTDIGGEGRVTGGDRFRITKAGGLPSGSDFIFRLLWDSGAVVGSVSYST